MHWRKMKYSLGKKKRMLLLMLLTGLLLTPGAAYGVEKERAGKARAAQSSGPGQAKQQQRQDASRETRPATGVTVQDPGIEKTASNAASEALAAGARQQKQQALINQINSLAAVAGGTYGVSVLELNSGNSFGVNQDQWFQAASTFKVPLLADVFQQIQDGKIDPGAVETYTPADYESGTGSIQYTDYGSQWTVAQLEQKMMNQSDNVAKNIFIRMLGLDQISDFITGNGSVFDVENNRTTPASMTNMLMLIYENKVVSPQLTGQMFDLMTNTYKEDELPRFLSGVRVAHKNGAWGSSVSDVGIVFLPGKPYVISVYNDSNPEPDQAEATIGQISLAVYNFENSN